MELIRWDSEMQIRLTGRVSRGCRRRYGKGRKWNLIYIPRIKDANERHGAINFDLMGRAETFEKRRKDFLRQLSSSDWISSSFHFLSDQAFRVLLWVSLRFKFTDIDIFLFSYFQGDDFLCWNLRNWRHWQPHCLRRHSEECIDAHGN